MLIKHAYARHAQLTWLHHAKGLHSNVLQRGEAPIKPSTIKRAVSKASGGAQVGLQASILQQCVQVYKLCESPAPHTSPR